MPEIRRDDASRDAVVALCSQGGKDAVVRQPLARWQAEALAAAFSHGGGDRKYWIEELSSLPAEGRVRRLRYRGPR